MALRPTPAVTSPAAEDEARLAMLRSCGVLDVTPDAELDRWTAALRRTTGAAFTALCFADSSRRLAKSVCTAAAPDERVAGLALTESLESYVAGLARPAGPTASGHSYAEAPIAVDGYVLGQIGMAAVDRPAWSVAEDPKWAPMREKAAAAGLGHCWSMPIKSAGGEVLGTLALYGPRPRLPLPEQLAWLEDWARLAGIAIERRQALGRLTHDARHDSLTGLPNRMAIFESLDDAIQRVEPAGTAAVLFIDLDGLKDLNDTFGHDHADEMIREVGERLAGAVRPGDFVGRFGGDEFVAIAERISDREEASRLGLRMLQAISQPLPGIDS